MEMPTTCPKCGKNLAWEGLNTTHEPKWERLADTAQWATTCPHCSQSFRISDEALEADRFHTKISLKDLYSMLDPNTIISHPLYRAMYPTGGNDRDDDTAAPSMACRQCHGRVSGFVIASPCMCLVPMAAPCDARGLFTEE